MEIVYHAENIIDANLVKGVLEREGITAWVQGSYLQGGIGELPPTDLISVAVSPSDAEPARSVLEKFEEHRAKGKGETRWDMQDSLLDWKG